MAALTSPPVSYDKIRVAFAQTMQAALGLSTNQVIQLQPEGPPASRPHLPFATFQLTGLGADFGRDSHVNVDADTYQYFGPRMLTVAFQFYGETHEQAWTLCSQWHAALDQEPTQDLLMALGQVSVWRRQPPSDLSAMLATGFEGRAAVNCSFGVQAQSTVTLSSIEQVAVSGQVGGDGNVTVTIFDGEG